MLTLYVATERIGFYAFRTYEGKDIEHIKREAVRVGASAFYIKDANGVIVYNSEEN